MFNSCQRNLVNKKSLVIPPNSVRDVTLDFNYLPNEEQHTGTFVTLALLLRSRLNFGDENLK